MSVVRVALNAVLRPFGMCIGRIVWTEGKMPPRWRAYRLLRLIRP
jgi:hypothetical protein